MTRTPRQPKSARRLINRKTLTCAGAGLALAGTAATVTGLTGGATAAADTASHKPVTAHLATSAGHAKTQGAATAKHASKQHKPARHPASHPARHPASHPASHPAAHRASHKRTWAAISRIVADRTSPKPAHGALPALDKLTPGGTSGQQTWMPITAARYGNAKTIVRQALDKHMGLRAAVVGVATSMQESGLLNIGYGDSDSLGLFQQRPSCGWGSPAQILRPAHAADAFLNALHGYAASDPGWAAQPLWQSAQGVQNSGFPTAYAKWEAQAAHLVATITPHLVGSA